MNKIDLSGAWKYKLDEAEILDGEEVFKEENFKEVLNLPGTTTSNKIGHKLCSLEEGLTKENLNGLREEFSYIGWAWYQKEVFIPNEWEGKTIILFLERVMFESEVWINGKNVGKNTSLSAPHKYTISNYIKFGEKNIIKL